MSIWQVTEQDADSNIIPYRQNTQTHENIYVYVLISVHKGLVKNVKKKEIAVLTQVQIHSVACSCRDGSNMDGT